MRKWEGGTDADLLYRSSARSSDRGEEANGEEDHERDRRGLSHWRHADLPARVSCGECRHGWVPPIGEPEDSRGTQENQRRLRFSRDRPQVAASTTARPKETRNELESRRQRLGRN